MLSSKGNTIRLLHILKEYSDEDHILSMKEVLSKMESIYDITMDRRTVYSTVETLLDLDYDISNYEENGKGYYLRTRDLEPSELRLVMDSIYSFSGITEKQTQDILSKLQLGLSVYQKKKYKNLRGNKSTFKTENKLVFYNIDILEEAISSKLKIEFDYMEYNLDKKLVPRRANKYLLSPYGMVNKNEHYYLIGNYDKYDNISSYRIDLIDNIKLTNEVVKPKPPGFDTLEHVNSRIYMIGGTKESVELICDSRILDDVISKFGKDIFITKIDENTFKLNFKIIPDGIKFWALQYMEYCEVVRPPWLREEVTKTIEEAAKRYK